MFCSGVSNYSWWIFKPLIFAAGCYVFSVIFWATKKQVDKKSPKKKK